MSSQSRLLKDIAELTSFGQASSLADGEGDSYDDGTSALHGSTNGEWIIEGGKKQQQEVRPRPSLRLAQGMDFDDDERYKGKKTSRKALMGFMEDGEENDESGDDYDEDGEEEHEEEEDEEEEAQQNGHHRGELDDEDDEDEDTGSSGEEDDEDEEEEASSEEEEENDDDDDDDGSDLEQEMKRIREDKQDMAVLLKRSRDETKAKAEQARHHRDLWNKLLEVRILLQRLMGMANRFPRPENYQQYKQADEQTATGFQDISVDLRSTLSTLVAMRSRQAAHLEEKEGGAAISKKRRRLSLGEGAFEGPIGGADDPWVQLQEDYDVCKTQWKQVLDAAHQRATLSVAVAKRFRVISQGLWTQIEASLMDRQRAYKRSHRTKAQAVEAKVIGGLVAGSREGEEEEEEEVDLEAFDDSDLYQQLLKDYIQSVRPSGNLGYSLVVGGAAARARRIKKKIDTKASKGRKLRYAVHPKLEHFMFPIPPPKAPMEIDRLFASLPGRLTPYACR